LPAASGGWIRIFSADAFPYASTDEYIQDGLVAHYDGINNADMGDKYHDNAATVWKNLKGITTLPDAEMCISANCQTQGLGGNISWTSNSAYIDNANVNNWFRINRTDYIPDEYTLEVVYKTNADYISTARDLVSNWNFGGFGFSSSGGIGNGYFDENEVGLVQWLETKELPNPGGGNHYKTSEGIFFAKNQLLTLSGQLINNDIDGCWLSVYVNGEGRSKQISTSAAQTKMPNIPTVWSIGADPQGSGSAACYQKDAHFYSVRVYNTMLSQLQIQHNTALDQKRYLAPPTVTIDGSPCTNVTVLSPRIITCLAPPSGTTGPATVIVDKAEGGNLLTLTNEFEYLP
ncbi:MAG: hypothetical protein LBS16_03630, partial [Prevotellaceae bacterium]|nr:hypothetical protein [Prevotellaceae bacterium]